MAKEPEPIKVTIDTDLSDLLEKADAAPIVLERNGVRFLLEKVDETGADDDPAKVRAALATFGGSWSDIDADKMIEDIYRWREEGSRPASRPVKLD